MPCDSHQAALFIVLELAMTAPYSHNVPTVLLDALDYIANFHVAAMTFILNYTTAMIIAYICTLYNGNLVTNK